MNEEHAQTEFERATHLTYNQMNPQQAVGHESIGSSSLRFLMQTIYYQPHVVLPGYHPGDRIHAGAVPTNPRQA